VSRRHRSPVEQRRVGPLRLPEGWRVVRAEGPRPFVTRAVLQRPDGSSFEWSSRGHRKRLAMRPAAERRRRLVAGASARSWWIGGLFMIGSFCFGLGSLPLYFDHIAAETVAITFFVGSIFFTSAAYLQFQEALDAPTGPEPGGPVPAGVPRFVAVSPHRIDWWATAVQFAGTIMFNISTLAAIDADLDLTRERRLIWGPDVIGSAFFLIASWLAFAEVGPRRWRREERTLGWWIGALNMVGSIAFGVSAVAARYVTTTGEPANITLVNLGTFAGAVCFFAGAALLPVESAREGRE
jgi:hypothetical protein